ncbi:SDR family NAD(P)-dependent oxidoreductase [Nonomuraea sp. MCN248]|uniref:SDR family NAD(P)-dependent oxidoreductase n=1 Tax=Nonomuraea corallina TaxID=2989783 RepID=A0ABT4SE38_9ACTN|nr:SDR family NAD(P)-dependent oxidoreductase [Nonomuraea corallina]MDA0635459.1 SDR family NAD(P)-dependent oxidoreductase [Nonomuraea corallina]
MPLDLAQLDSVRAFAASVRERLGGGPVDALVCNAGVVLPEAGGRTVDGFETTFAVNHLAHYLLSRLLLPVLADGARIVLTTSGAHDPATRAGLRRTYASLRRARLTWPDPSELARGDEPAQALWRDSAELVGLPE